MDVHVVTADVSLLLELPDMDRLGIFFNNLEDLLVNALYEKTVSTTCLFGHAFIRWKPHMNCHFTELELRGIHRRFGHSSTQKLYKLLNRAALDAVHTGTYETIRKIERACHSCQVNSQRPHRFKFPLREDKEFNLTVQVQVFYIKKKPVLHVVDEATNYQAASWLSNV